MSVTNNDPSPTEISLNSEGINEQKPIAPIKEKPKFILLNPEEKPDIQTPHSPLHLSSDEENEQVLFVRKSLSTNTTEIGENMEEKGNDSVNPFGESTMEDLENPFGEKLEIPADQPNEKANDLQEITIEEDSQEITVEKEDAQELSIEPVENQLPEVIASEENSEAKPEDIYEEEKRQIMIELLYKKRNELVEKQQSINKLHSSIADLEKPAIHDVGILRQKIDNCFTEIDSLKSSKRQAEATVNKAQSVQRKLETKLSDLNEKKKIAIFEFESKHLQKLKEIEEVIRELA